jgi:hypothetical protein
MNYYLWLNEQQQGPFEEGEIRELLRTGEITGDTSAYTEGIGGWQPLHALFPEIAASVVPTALPTTSEGENAPPPSPPRTDGPARFSGKDSFVEVWLASRSVKIKEVLLFDEVKLQELMGQKAEAMRLMEGEQSPYIPIGSVTWVILASTVTRALEQNLSEKSAHQGRQLLQHIATQEKALREQKMFFHVSEIQDIEHPIPGLWRVLVGPRGFIHEGGEFVFVKDVENRTYSIRWTSVDSYQFVPAPESEAR